MQIVWTEYLQYKAQLRGFDLLRIEAILKSSPERYFDTATRRRVAIGRHGDELVMIPYEAEENSVTPVTIHVTTRTQILVRIKTGRLIHE